LPEIAHGVPLAFEAVDGRRHKHEEYYETYPGMTRSRYMK
jgi:hypothetical protein